MTPFTVLTGVAAPLPLANVDTDKIIPSRFLKTLTRTGLARSLFADLRYDESGAERADFTLNRPAYRRAAILIALENFGCGSSREHAPWALADFGIRCVIAPSFADIFYNNALKNGLLPVRLPRAACEALMAEAELGANARVTVDLERQVVIRATGETLAFDIDPLRRERLLHGLDDIAETLRSASAIDAYEACRAAEPRTPELFIA